MNTTDAVYEALADRYTALGGYDYDKLEESDQTGAPFMWTRNNVPVSFGLTLNPDASRGIEVTAPEGPETPWTYQVLDNNGGDEAGGTLAMTWDQWNSLRTDEAAAVLTDLLLSAERADSPNHGPDKKFSG
jgi:hypothetical protein